MSTTSESVKLLKTMSAFLSEEEAVPTTDEIVGSLKRQGVDMGKLLKDIRKQAVRAENRLRLQMVANEIKNTAVQPVVHILASVQELRDMVSAHISTLGSSAAVEAFYRKLETAEEVDLQSLLNDFEELTRHISNEDSDCSKSD